MKAKATRAELIEVAQGIRPADLFIKGGTVINVYSGEFLHHHVAVYKDCIAYVGESEKAIGEQTLVIDATGKYVSPGFIEVHAHPWVIYNPVSQTEKVLPLGTTTTVNDNLFFYLHMGASGFKEMLKDLEPLPGSFLWLARLVSQADFSGEREWFNQADVLDLLEQEEVMGTAEVTRWPLLYQADPFVLGTVDIVNSKGKIVDGHTAGCSYDKLNSIAASGVSACHEAITASEAYDRLRLGLWTTLRNSSLRPDMAEIIKMITEGNVSTNRILMTTDGPHPAFIQEEGFVDGLVRRAVELGLPAMTAIQMVTLNAATFLRLDHVLGGIAPGRCADLLLFPDLEKFRPELVIAGGEVVATHGKLTAKLPEIQWDKYMIREPFSIAKAELDNAELYRYPHESSRNPVPIVHFRSTVITQKKEIELPTVDGYADLSNQHGLVYAALIQRDGEWITRGILDNFAVSLEGMASTYNTTTELLAIGRDPHAMAKAAGRVYELGGGVVIVERGEIVLEIPLPVTGMMTDSPSFDVAVEYQNRLLTALKERGYPFHDILYTLLFLTCDFLPGLRLVPRGLYEVKTDEVLLPPVPLKTKKGFPVS